MADGLSMRIPQIGKTAKGPTPLLSFLAGPHAELVATCWPAPHERFFALPAARRHAGVILLARGERDFPVLARALERYKDADIARRLMDGDMPAGLMKAMGRMGETQWRLEDYERFLTLFDDDQANQVLRHMDQIDPAKLALISELPAGLRHARVVAMTPNLAAAYDLRLAFHLALRVHGVDRASRLIDRWGRTKDSSKLFEKAAADLEPERFARPAVVPEMPADFEPVLTRKRLGEVALEFQNCLRDFACDLAMGRMAVFIRRAQPATSLPPVALAFRWDAAGWRLAEAEVAANESVPEPQLRDLVKIVTARGVRTGPSVNSVIRRLHRHPHGDAEYVGESWSERLELGELWD